MFQAQSLIDILITGQKKNKYNEAKNSEAIKIVSPPPFKAT